MAQTYAMMILEIQRHQAFKTKGCAILTSADRCSNERRQQPVLSTCSAFSKVLIIGYNFFDRQYTIYAFSSDESSWSMPKRCFDPLEDGIQPAPFHLSAVVCLGRAHWLFQGNSNTLLVSVPQNIMFIHMFLVPFGDLRKH
jgi:hypothetical protein